MQPAVRSAMRLVQRSASVVHAARVTAMPPFKCARTLRTSAPLFASKADFDKASEAVQRLPSVSNEDKLKLYALFKQATVGANNTPKPGTFDFVGKAKHAAWSALGSMPPDDARAAYVAHVLSLGGSLAAPAAGTQPVPAAAAGASDGPVRTAVEGRVTSITLNRPEKRNAITIAMYRDLIAAMGAAAADASTTVTLLTGAGAFFSSGNDLTNFTENMPPEGPVKMAEDGKVILHAFVNAFIRHPKILVVALNGAAVGIAVTTLPLADFVYASHKATLHAPLTALGQCPEGTSSLTFPRVLGPTRAAQLLLAGEKIDAATGKAWGLITDVYEDGEFRAQVAQRVSALASLPPQALLASKRLIREPIIAELEAANTRECDEIKKRWLSDECMAAITKFVSGKGGKSK